MDIGKKLKELRLQNDLTLNDLASRSELDQGIPVSGGEESDDTQYCYPGGYIRGTGNEHV